MFKNYFIFHSFVRKILFSQPGPAINTRIITIRARKPGTMPAYWSLTYPFTRAVWFMVAVSIVTVGFALALLNLPSIRLTDDYIKTYYIVTLSYGNAMKLS